MGGERTQDDLLPVDRLAGENAHLVASIGSGDRAAEQTFVELYLPRVKVMLLARTRNADLAADLVHDVMLESLCALRRGQLREAAKLSSFVLAIARNVLNSHFRSAARDPEGLEFPDDLPDPASVAEKFESGEREARALRAIEMLDATDRMILQMTLVDGLKPGVIAQRLRLSPDVVRQRKLRATRRVMEHVNERSQKYSSLHLVPGQMQ